MIPFLVVDRPISLRIVKGAELSSPIGLMSHANTTKNFRQLFRDYPCGEKPCHAIDPSGNTCCFTKSGSKFCETALQIRDNTVKICDCGIFTKEGVQLSYEKLFQIYDEMGADYGIMIDVLRDRSATVKSAKKALKIYRQQDYSFNLVLVAQGNDLLEYLKCYQDLLDVGGEYIAVGGLLQRRVNTARYVYVKNTAFMTDVLRSIREEFNPRWLYALGCYHPKRLQIFEDLGVWGSDYKGWIFQYKKRERLIQENWMSILERLVDIECVSGKDSLITPFAELVQERSIIQSNNESSEYKTSRRNLSIDDRDPLFIRIDKELLNSLAEIYEKSSLDGSSSVIEQKSNEIKKLTSMTEQQIRFQQLRALLRKLGQTDISNI